MSSRVNGVSPRDNPRRHLPHQSAWSRAWFALWVSLGLVFPVPVQALAQEDGVCDRTEEIRDAIVAAVTGVTDCAEITETQLGQITTLTLFGLNITALAADDLVGLSGLVTLNLAYNRLTALPEMVFDPLTSLDTLWLNNNQLQTLPADVFAGLTGLDDLRLASNPGFPFGPVAEAGPTFFVSTDREVTLQGSGGSDPWGRSVTYAWTQSDSSGVVVPLDGPTTATPGLTAPAVEQETVFRFGLTVTAVNPGGVAPPGTTTAGDSATDWTLVRVQAAVPVSVYFHEAKYVATEGGTAATVEIRLDKIPRRSVSIPLKAIPAGGADAADYSIPPSVTFGYVDRVKYVTVTATDDGVDDDGESLTLGFGDPFPVAVARGSPSSVTVELADNDDPVGVGISGLSVTSDPGTDSVYVSGDALEVTATFSDIVTVSGRPQLALSVGTSITALLGRAERNAGYVRGSGTTKLVFAYGVVAGDNDPDGVSVAAGSLDLNGGSVQDGESADAVLAHDSLAVQPGHRVDALAPTLAEAFVDGSELTLRYSEPLDETSVPPPTAFSVSVEGASRTVSDVGVSGKFVNVTLATAVQPGEEASVGYSLPPTGSIRDKVGLAATAFSNQSVTNYTLPTVSIAAVDPNVYEGADVDFELTRNGPNDRSLRATVRVQDSGDVLLGTSGYKNVKFAAGDSTAWLTLKTHDDHGYEAHATVSATAIGGAYHVSETAGTASVTVSDNDVPETDVTLSGPDSVAEEVDTFVVQVSARTVSDEEPHGSLSVRLRSSDGTAKAGSDFTSVRETVRFLPADFTRIEEGGEGRYVATASQAVTILDDSLQEDDETFALELTRSYVIGDNVNLPLEPLVVTIVDTDTLPGPGAVTGLSVTEGDAQLALSWSAVSGATGYKVQWKSGTETFADAAADARQHVISSGTTTARTITGLANGTPYTVRVIATNSAGDGPPSDEKTGTPTAPPPRPGAVTGLSVTEGDAQLALSWSAVSGATGYKVQWKSGTETFADAAADARQHVISSGTTTARTITGLANGTPYTVRVIATNSAGDGPPSDEKTGTPTAPPPRPGAVTGLSVTEGDAQLALSWSAVSGATGYKVQWKSGTETFADAAADARQHVISSGTTTARTITGLANGTPYTVRVIATNSAGDGPPSDEKTGTPTAPPPRPGAVTGLSVTEGDAQLALSWSAVSGATGYKVQWKSGTETFADAAADARQHVISSGTTTARTITGLANGTPYTVRVIATNSVGDGPPSDEKTGTPTAPPPRPGAVTGLSVTEGDAQLALSWSAVGGATGYKVQWKSGTETFADAAADARQHVISSGTTTARTITGLANGTPYTVRVIATNSVGDGPPSDEKTGTPTAPPPRPGAVTGLSVTEGDAQLALSWSAVSGATGYKVQWKSGTETFADAAADARQHVISSGTTTARTITGLANGTPYTVRVIATNSAGDGPPSDEKTGTPTAPPPRPGAVTGLSVTEGDAQLALSWSAVSGATGYKVQWKSGTETFADAAADARQHVISSGTTTARTITGLANGTPYTVRVIATNSAGDGPPSDEKTGTPTAPPPRPGAVTGLSVTEGDAQLALSWSAVGGATGYKVQWKSGTETFADAAADARQHVISSGTTTARTITGLANGTPYTVRVIATNSAGDGPPSDEKTGTPTAPPPRPGAVTGLSVTEGDAQLALSWSAVSGATGYKVQWKSGTETFADAAADARQHVISSGTTTARTITGLANGTPYTVRVIATNSAGDGPPSDEKTGTPTAPPPRPGAVTGLSVTEGDAQLALSWSAVSGATGYKVQWKSGTETFADAAADARQHVISSGTTTARTITGLANGTPYTVRVIATNSVGDGPPSDEKTGTPTAPPPRPGAVTGLSVTEGDAQLALSWSAVSGATGYKVQWKSGTETFADAAADARQHVISSGTTTARTITGLANGTPYTVRVIATNSVGDGPPSDEKTGTPTAPPPRPGAVTGLSVTEGDAQLALSWSAVSGATGYKVQWKSGTETFADAAADARQHVISSGTTTARTITGLANGTPYTVRVIATNSAGDGPPSDEKTGTPTAPPPRPGAVTGLSVTEGDAQLALSWSAVSGATGYKVQWKSGTETFADAAADARQHVISSGTTTARTITGLANGTPYTVRVIATNGRRPPFGREDRHADGAAAPAGSTGLSDLERDDDRPHHHRSGQRNAVHGAGDRDQLGGRRPPFGREDRHADGAAAPAGSGDRTVGDGGRCSVGPVLERGERGHGLQGAVEVGYGDLRGRRGGRAPACDLERDDDRPHHHRSGQRNAYTVRVIATNSVGDGPPSDEKTGTPTAPPPRPGAVTGLSVTEGDAQLALSWSAVSGATGYKVQWKSGTETFADAAADARQHVISSGTTTARTITGLANGTPYTVRVIATNSVGDGPPSDEKTGTPTAPVATPGLRVTTLAMSLREGDSKTYGVALGSAPAASVTVTVGGWPGTDVEVEPSSLVFTTSNWGASQTVTVTAKQDDHYESTHEVTLTHNSGAGVAGPSLKVTVIDDDGPLPSVSLRALSDSVKEGEVIGFELTRTPPLGGALRGGIFVFDLETGSYSDAMVAFYFQPGDATDRISYRVKIDTLVTTDRTVKAMINPTFDGYEPGSPREATVSVIDQTVNQASGDTAPETGVAFSGAPLAATEGEDITVVVRLSEPAEANVTIPLVVSGLGGANDEDWDVPSEVVIKGGDSLGAVLISAVDDAEEDPGESLELSFGTLPLGFAAADPRKVVVDIEDNDQFRMGAEETRGWLARFGRAASGEAVEAVRERMGAGLRPSEESRVRVGGDDLSAWRAAMFPVGGRAGVAPAPASGSEVTSSRAGSQARVFFGRLFSGTSFTRTGAFGQDASRRWSVWGRGGVSSFDGRDGALSLSGDLTTVTLGADYGSGRALGGVVLSRSTADGSLAGGDGPGGQVETTLMAAYPWLRYALTDRVSVWGMGGYGAGSMPGSPGDAGAGMDVEMRMGALGAAGQLVSTRALALALSSDALFTRTSAAGATMPGDAGADVSRVRLMLEGSSSIEVAGGTLRPTFEVGFRQDGGDAETGAGLEAGGGFGYSLPSLGLAVEGRVRGLIAHENDGYDEWGASGLVRIAPDPSGRGLNLNLSPSWGSAGPGGARALWSRRNMAGIATRPGGASGVGSGSVVLDLGYGLAVSRQTIVTPYGGTMDGARRLGLRVRTGPSLQIKLENVEGNGHGGLLLNAAYRSGSFLRLAFEARRNTAGEMSLGLTGQVGER